MIDIHSHIIQNVDDGSKSIESSIKLLEEEISMGVTDIVCTPHYRRHMFETTSDELKLSFLKLNEYVKNLKLNVNLYLGQEIFCRSLESFRRTLDFIENEKVLTFNGSKYILLEFSYTEDIDITEIAYTAICKGYTPIIAHIERYVYIDSIEKVEEIREVGALVQINASSIVGKDGRRAQKNVKKFIKNNLIDFVSSDIHESRINYMKKAYDYVCKKFNNDIADDLFTNNALKLIKNIENQENAQIQRLI